MVTPSSAVPSSELVGLDPGGLKKVVRFSFAINHQLDLLVLGLVGSNIGQRNISIHVLEPGNRANGAG
jgi:hypothetical protein